MGQRNSYMVQQIDKKINENKYKTIVVLCGAEHLVKLGIYGTDKSLLDLISGSIMIKLLKPYTVENIPPSHTKIINYLL